MRAALLQRLGTFALLVAGTSAAAQPAAPSTANGCAVHVAEAASRSGLSPQLVLRVMMAESGGNVRIVSPKGAMGCMQIMPATWAYLTSRYNLGTDPFDARRNMIGGAMYLAELTARYGPDGAIAAYNAGPGRYERYASGAASLPAETIAYTRRIGSSEPRPVVVAAVERWQEAGLFLARATIINAASDATSADPQPPARIADRLFPLARSLRPQAASAPAP